MKDESEFNCKDCGHRHSGVSHAYICIGCPCPVVPCERCANDENLEGYPDPYCSQCKGIGFAAPTAETKENL